MGCHLRVGRAIEEWGRPTRVPTYRAAHFSSPDQHTRTARKPPSPFCTSFQTSCHHRLGLRLCLFSTTTDNFVVSLPQTLRSSKGDSSARGAQESLRDGPPRRSIHPRHLRSSGFRSHPGGRGAGRPTRPHPRAAPNLSHPKAKIQPHLATPRPITSHTQPYPAMRKASFPLGRSAPTNR